jgi:hypothetical protein
LRSNDQFSDGFNSRTASFSQNLAMGDSWEDWEDEEVAIPLPAAIKSPDKTKFEDEDAEEEAPAWEGLVPKSEQVRLIQHHIDVCFTMSNASLPD